MPGSLAPVSPAGAAATTSWVGRLSNLLAGLGVVLGVVQLFRASPLPEQRRVRPVSNPLALFPADAQLVVAIDLSRVRDTPVAKRIGMLLAQAGDPAPDWEIWVDELVLDTGFRPGRDVESVTLAVSERKSGWSTFGVLVRATHLDQARLVAHVREKMRQRGAELVSSAHGSRALWSERGSLGTSAFFLDDRTLVLGSGGWAERMAELADRPSSAATAETNAPLVALCKRVAPRYPIWVADGRGHRWGELDIQRGTVGVELGGGLHAALTVDVADRAKADALVAKAKKSMAEARADIHGPAPTLRAFVDGIQLAADAATVQLALDLSEDQARALVDGVAEFLAVFNKDSLFP
jgi:hypothetical protein